MDILNIFIQRQPMSVFVYIHVSIGYVFEERPYSALQLALGFLILRAPQYVSSSRQKTGVKDRVSLTPSNLQPFRMVILKGASR